MQIPREFRDDRERLVFLYVREAIRIPDLSAPPGQTERRRDMAPSSPRPASSMA